jgi:hypothetical protein
VSIAIPKLEILEDVDFFELSAETLTGFRDAVRGAIVNEAARLFISGVDLSSFEMRMKPYGLSQFGIQLSSDGLVLLNADVDVKKLIFDGDMHGG